MKKVMALFVALILLLGCLPVQLRLLTTSRLQSGASISLIA